MKLNFKSKKKIVIKVGSSLLVSGGKFREKWLKDFTKNIAELIKKDFQVVVVSSGAIALGRTFLRTSCLNFTKHKNLSLKEKQAAAAFGQTQLMSFYRDFFKKFKLDIAQILLTVSDCNIRNRYLNCRNTIETLLESSIIPIINENDSIAFDEIKIGDNDRLAARIAQMISADLMILFSDVDGLYNKNPRTHKSAKLIPEVLKITKEVEMMAGSAGSDVGTGGMITKISAAKMLANSSCDTIIANGFPDNSLKKLFEGKQGFTVFYGQKKSLKQRKSWLSGFINAKGEVIINKCAAKTLSDKKISLLPIGVIALNGNFKEGDAIFIKDEEGNHIANGISNYSSLDLEKVFGKKTTEVKKILEKAAKPELVHIDNLVLV